MTYLPITSEKEAFITTTTLVNGVSYVSPVFSLAGYLQIQVEMLSDKSGLVTVEFFSDSSATNLVSSHIEPYISTLILDTSAYPTSGKYARVTVLNNSGAGQTNFYLSAKLLTASIVSDFTTDVGLGKLPNHSSGIMHGLSFELAVGSMDTVWPLAKVDGEGGSMSKTLPTSSAEIFIVSDNVADTSDIYLEYLDANLALVGVTVTLTGQTPVSVATGFDCNTAELVSDNATLAGSVAIYKGTATLGLPDDITLVLAYITPDFGRTQQLTYTVPLNKTLVITKVSMQISRQGGALCSAMGILRIKKPGSSWQAHRTYTLTNAYSTDREDLIVLHTGAQVEMKVTDVSDLLCTVTGQYNYQLIDNA